MIDRRAALLVLILPALLSPALNRTTAQTIQAIQGRGHVSPLLGADVTGVEGVVTTLASMGTRRGAFLQDPRAGGDGDPATSDAVFVALPSDLMGEIRPGDLVRVAGRVGEQRGASTGLSVTQIEVRMLERVARDVALPQAVRIGATGRVPPGWIAPPIGGAIDGPAHVPDPGRYSLDFYETLEGMRVVLGDAQAIGPRNSYGEVAVAPDFARAMPLANARGGATTGAGATIAGRLIADDVLIGRDHDERSDALNASALRTNSATLSPPNLRWASAASTSATIVSATTPIAGTAVTSVRSLKLTVSSLVTTSTVFRVGRFSVASGFMAARTTSNSPVVMPPSVPPASVVSRR
jgi:hypothetical protein